jgi:serine-type D-Ala-D-Ala carboxypeptidase (penicillin-binding protein 5/6)
MLTFIVILVLGLVPSLVLGPSIPVSAAVLAPYWVIVDAESGAVLDHESKDTRVAMASLTKTMTGLLAAEQFDLNRLVTIVESDLVGEASIYLEAGDVITMRTLLHGLLMRSGNDAAMAIARAVGGSPHADDPAAREQFIGMMNQRARELGMSNTSFRNPHCLDEPFHYSTAYDLSLRTQAVLTHPTLVAAFGATTYSGDGRTFQHSNQLAKTYPNIIGGKTGWTDDAGLCLIEVAERDGRRLIVVLLGSTFERWYADAAELLDYGWSIPQPANGVLGGRVVFEWWRARTDGPVEQGIVERSWLWGPTSITPVRYEAYHDAPDGSRLVHYFDKGRMEVTDPNAYINSGWYVTGGHLATELITGQQQIGDNAFVYRGPAHVPVAGDVTTLGPTYANFAQIRRNPQLDAGDTVTQTMSHTGQLGNDSALTRYDVEVGPSDPLTGHGVASVFDAYLDQDSEVVFRGEVVTRRLFDPRYAIVGLPITDPVWVHVPVKGMPRDVLVQCFERRCLTYTPSNPEEWRVEMGNIGQHYLRWLQVERVLSLYDMPQGHDRWAGKDTGVKSAGQGRGT